MSIFKGRISGIIKDSWKSLQINPKTDSSRVKYYYKVLSQIINDCESLKHKLKKDYKVCPKCGEFVLVDLDLCPYCKEKI